MDVERYEFIITRGGGKYMGMMEELVLFNAPKTGTTLALYERDLTVKAVRDSIAISNRQWGI